MGGESQGFLMLVDYSSVTLLWTANGALPPVSHNTIVRPIGNRRPWANHAATGGPTEMS